MQSGEISESKRKRRKRTDDEGRTFTCSCGKSYLSYPALYTHIKTKHTDESLSKLAKNYDNNYDSPMNGGTQRMQKQYSRQKQTTRQKEKQKKKQQQKQKQKQLQENYPLYGNSLPEVNNIQVLRDFLFKYFPNVSVKSAQGYKNDLTQAQKREFKQMKDYWSNNRKKQDQKFEQFYLTPINYVLGKFVLQLQTDVQNYSFKRYVSLFIFAIKRALDKIKDNKYFKENNAYDLPLFFDQILRDHLLVDSNDHLSNPTMAAKTIYYLSRWLYPEIQFLSFQSLQQLNKKDEKQMFLIEIFNQPNK